MGPDAALAELLELVDWYRNDEEKFDFPDWASSIADRIEGLHEWLSKGGMPPVGWTGNQGVEHECERRRVLRTFRSEPLPTTRGLPEPGRTGVHIGLDCPRFQEGGLMSMPHSSRLEDTHHTQGGSQSLHRFGMPSRVVNAALAVPNVLLPGTGPVPPGAERTAEFGLEALHSRENRSHGSVLQVRYFAVYVVSRAGAAS